RTMYVSIGAAQSLAENPCSPSLLSAGVFAESRHKRTARPESTAMTTVSRSLRMPSRHAATTSTRTPVVSAVSPIWLVVNTMLAPSSSRYIEDSRTSPASPPVVRSLAAMTLRVGVGGASGWAGRAVAEGVLAADDLELRAVLGRAAVGTDLGVAW